MPLHFAIHNFFYIFYFQTFLIFFFLVFAFFTSTAFDYNKHVSIKCKSVYFLHIKETNDSISEQLQCTEAGV